MSARKLWTQIHWLIGITAGTLLLVIGLSGATLAFREELTDLLNPGGRQVAPQAGPALTPEQLLQAIAARPAAPAVAMLTLSSQPGRAVRVTYAPKPGERRGESVYVDPYTAAPLPELHGTALFETAERLHRWLLLPQAQGRVATGVLAIGLLLLALTGLYLRWPREVLDWRAWWRVDTRLTGRAFLRRLHLVAGTACLPLYVVLTCTGIFWAFDGVRDPVSAWLGEPRPPRAAAKAEAKLPVTDDADATRPDLTPAWQTFQTSAAAGWREVVVGVPAAGQGTVQFTWLDADPAHERARNRLNVAATTGQVKQDDRFANKPLGGRALAAIYPLHMGTYFGLPGRIAMLLAALMLVFFGVTGWWLYLDRKRLARQAQRCSAERRAAQPA